MRKRRDSYFSGCRKRRENLLRYSTAEVGLGLAEAGAIPCELPGIDGHPHGGVHAHPL
jgi:hypothetical protein